MESISTFLVPQSKTTDGDFDSLNDIGLNIGQKLAHKLNIAAVPYCDPKDAIKCLCKDIWYYCFRQQASRLQANRKGVFVIHDSSFPPLQTLAKCTVPFAGSPLSRDPLSSSQPHFETLASRAPGDSTTVSSVASAPGNPSSRMHEIIIHRAHAQLQVTRGLIEGFMAAVGFHCQVEDSMSECIPACAFSVTLKQSSSNVLDPSRLLSNVNEQEAASI